MEILGRFDSNGPSSVETMEAAERQFGIQFPADYKRFMVSRDGGEGFVGSHYLILWRAGELASWLSSIVNTRLKSMHQGLSSLARTEEARRMPSMFDQEKKWEYEWCLSPDPLGHAASMSLYDYCNGDPVNGLDPTGRCSNNSSASSGFSLGGNSNGFPISSQNPYYRYNDLDISAGPIDITVYGTAQIPISKAAIQMIYNYEVGVECPRKLIHSL